MRLLDFLPGGRQLSVAWSFAPGPKVWRMLPTLGGTLVGEARDEETKQVSFFALDLERGTVHWKGRTVGEEWWVGIETALADTVLLHLFARPDMPEPAGIIALGMETGREKWTRPGYRILAASTDEVFVSDPADDVGNVSVLSAETGEVNRKVPADSPEYAEARSSAVEPSDVLYPRQFGEGSEEWLALIPHIGKARLVGLGEGVEVDGRRIFSYHSSESDAEEGKSFDHAVIVVDSRGKRLYRDVLHRNAHMPVYDSFFVRKKRLYYVRRESEVVCVAVTPDES